MMCVVLCAGKGTRIGGDTPKPLIQINGSTILERIVRFWEKNGVDRFWLVVNEDNEDTLRKFAKKLKINWYYSIQREQKGIAHALLCVESILKEDENFVLALGDCVQDGEFTFIPKWTMGIGVLDSSNWDLIRTGYEVMTEGDTIIELREKPMSPCGGSCGMGTYFLHRRVFDYIRLTPPSKRGEIEITDVLSTMLAQAEPVLPIMFTGSYINVNTEEDLKKAEEIFPPK